MRIFARRTKEDNIKGKESMFGPLFNIDKKNFIPQQVSFPMTTIIMMLWMKMKMMVMVMVMEMEMVQYVHIDDDRH